jgi:hypothetical protein
MWHRQVLFISAARCGSRAGSKQRRRLPFSATAGCVSQSESGDAATGMCAVRAAVGVEAERTAAAGLGGGEGGDQHGGDEGGDWRGADEPRAFFNPNPRARCGANYIYQSTPPTGPNKRLISIKAEIQQL